MKAVLTAALLLGAGLGQAVAGGPPAAPQATLAAVLRDLDAILLAGEALPPDFILTLAPLPPAERLLAAAYARRAGLLTGAALPLAGLLADPAGARP